MKEVASYILEVGRVSGRNAKLELLRKYKDVSGFKEILQFIYNPYIRTGIAKKKLDKVINLPTDSELDTHISWQDVISYFTKNRCVKSADYQ